MMGFMFIKRIKEKANPLKTRMVFPIGVLAKLIVITTWEQTNTRQAKTEVGILHLITTSPIMPTTAKKE